MEDISLRNYAHLGDAVWELFVREHTIKKTPNTKVLHKLTTDRVRASYQAKLLTLISSELTDEENDLARRARNATVPVARRNNQNEYRHATAFEALIGFWYLNNKERLKYFLDKFNNLDDFH